MLVITFTVDYFNKATNNINISGYDGIDIEPILLTLLIYSCRY